MSLTDYGAFVELEPGVEGLVHVSEMSWTHEVRHPSRVVSIGDQVEAAVLNVDPASRKISLGMKQTAPNPWDMVEGKYPIGTRIEGKVKSLTDFGAFIGLGRRHRRVDPHLRHVLDEAHQASIGDLQEGSEGRGRGPCGSTRKKSGCRWATSS